MAFYSDRGAFTIDVRWEGWAVLKSDMVRNRPCIKIRLFYSKLLNVMYR